MDPMPRLDRRPNLIDIATTVLIAAVGLLPFDFIFVLPWVVVFALAVRAAVRLLRAGPTGLPAREASVLAGFALAVSIGRGIGLWTEHVVWSAGREAQAACERDGRCGLPSGWERDPKDPNRVFQSIWTYTVSFVLSEDGQRFSVGTWWNMDQPWWLEGGVTRPLREQDRHDEGV